MMITRYKNPGQLSRSLRSQLFALTVEGEVRRRSDYLADGTCGFMWPTLLQWDAAKRKRTNGLVRAWGGDDVWVGLRPWKGYAPAGFGPEGYTQWVQRSYILVRDYYICVATEGKKVIGWCILDFDDCFNIYVDESQRGKRIGYSLAQRFARVVRVRRVGFQTPRSSELMQYATSTMGSKRDHFQYSGESYQA